MKPESHIFESLPIGGGGYVTGMVIHPLDSTIKYIRTDVGGAYRWNEEDDRWDSMTDFFGWNQRFLCGIDGIAVDPNNKDIVYICCGDGGNLESGGHPALYKSEDRGHTFKRTSLEVTFFGNANPERADGECIMVDPLNSNVLYVGSRTKGFFISHDGAETFERNYTVPVNGYKNAGTRGVVIDSAEEIDGRSKIIYLNVPGTKDYNGIYVSRDGGVSFKLIDGSPKNVHRMELPIDRKLYVSCDDGFLVYDGENWNDISPNKEISAYHGMAVCKDDPKIMVVCEKAYGKKCMNLNIYYSKDGGKSWAQKNSNMEKLDKVPWWPGYYFSSATCHMLFDPHDSASVYFTDWYGVWMTDDIESEKTFWRLKVKGHEEAVVFDIKTVPEGDIELLTGMADNGGMYYRSLSEYPERRRDHQFCYIDFAENEYNKIVMCGSGNSGVYGGIYISYDYGVTYKINENWGTAPAMRIAVSCDDSKNWVIVSNNKDVSYTLDDGETFHDSEGAPKNLINAFWFSPFPLCSDRKKRGTFYIACKEGFFRSDNGGVSFKNVCPDMTGSTCPIASPQTAGLVLVLKDGKINISRNFGDSFEQMEEPYDVRSISFGKGKDENSEPVLYFLGKLGGKDGVFASEDMGKSFLRLNTDDNKLGKGNFISGDRRCYGRCFIGTGGRGIIIGHI